MDVAQIGKVYAQLDPPLWLVTSAHDGRRGGFIATTVAQASIVDVMPRQILTVNKRHNTHALIEASGAFAMHLIDETHIELVWRFGLQSGRDVDKLAGLQFHIGATGSPLLADALAWFDCRVESRMDSGDRTIYLAAVLDGRPATNRAPTDEQPFLRHRPAGQTEDHGRAVRATMRASTPRRSSNGARTTNFLIDFPSLALQACTDRNDVGASGSRSRPAEIRLDPEPTKVAIP